MNDNFNRYMTPQEVYASVQLGNRIVSINQQRPTYNSALRYEIAKNGTAAAVALAQRLCGMTGAEAHRHINNLRNSKNSDIQDLYANRS